MKKQHIDGAILTLTGYFNYGNIIQRYALQEFLHQNGYNFVSYVDPYSAPRDVYKISKRIKVKTPLRVVKRFLNYQKPYWYIPKYSEIYPDAERLDNIINFVNKNILIKPFDPDDNYNNYIVGSDQVWRDWWGDREVLGYYFFNFLKDRKANRIAYAASFGKDKIEDIMGVKDADYIRPYIKQFNSISVREASAIELINKTWGIKGVDEVADPTLLLDKNDYSKLIEKSNVKYEKIQPIFTYVLGETPEIQSFIQKVQYTREQAATHIRAHSGGDTSTILKPVESWLKGFRDAELVVTNSFHGMMFSIINNTDFIIIGREVGGLSRIKDFLDKYGIEGRFVDEDKLASFDIKNMKDIDWKSVNEKLDQVRIYSGNWLLNAIK